MFKISDRSYTGHEYLSQFALINMNGRVYDPVLAQFIQPDNYIQMPEYAQSYNRYSYVLNNPLKYKDPSGELIDPASILFYASLAYSAFNAAQGMEKAYYAGGTGAMITSLAQSVFSFAVGYGTGQVISQLGAGAITSEVMKGWGGIAWGIALSPISGFYTHIMNTGNTKYSFKDMLGGMLNAGIWASISFGVQQEDAKINEASKNAEQNETKSRFMDVIIKVEDYIVIRAGSSTTTYADGRIPKDVVPIYNYAEQLGFILTVNDPSGEYSDFRIFQTITSIENGQTIYKIDNPGSNSKYYGDHAENIKIAQTYGADYAMKDGPANFTPHKDFMGTRFLLNNLNVDWTAHTSVLAYHTQSSAWYLVGTVSWGYTIQSDYRMYQKPYIFGNPDFYHLKHR